jgi:alanine transaminase
LFGGSFSGYYLDEEQHWSTPLSSIENAYNEAIKNGKDVRALVVINPGNPTGGILSVKNQQDIVKFCVEKKIILMADVRKFPSKHRDRKSIKKIFMEMFLLFPLRRYPVKWTRNIHQILI